MGRRTWRLRLIFLMLISTLSYGMVFGFVPTLAASPPGAPQKLTSTSSTSSISLIWSAPASDGGSPIIGYYVYRGTTSGGEGFYGFASNTAFADQVPLVAPSTTYYYKVDAVNGIGEGAFSSEIARSPISPPSAPQNPSAKAGGGVVTLTATPPTSNGGSPLSGYIVYRGTTAGSEVAISGGNLPFYDTGVTTGTTYYYKLAAYNVAGSGALSSEVSATPAAPAAPSAPQSLVATAGGGVVILTWTPPTSNGNSPIYAYQILRSTSTGTEVLYSSSGNVTTTYIDPYVGTGVTYYYEVTAVNVAAQASVVSNEASATPSAPSAPSPPLSLAAIFTVGGINLTWSGPTTSGNSPLHYYNIYKGTTSGGETLTYSTSPTSFRDFYYALSPATTYYYKVSATNYAGLESSLSNEASASTPATNPPSAPQGLAASAGAAYGVPTVTLTYAAPTSSGGWPLSGPTIFRGTTSGGEVSYAPYAANLTYFIDSAVSAGTTYYYKVQYSNIKGTVGSLSSEVSVTVPSAPSAPQTLVATGSSGRISLSWAAPASNGASPILGYYVYRGTASGNESFYTITAGTSYTDSGVSVGTTYYYKVVAFSAGGFQSSPSSEANAKPASPTPLTPASLLLAALATATIPILWRHKRGHYHRV